jgi:hypothetical protein
MGFFSRRRRMSKDYDEDSGEPSDEYFPHAYEDPWNHPEFGQDARRRRARGRCSHIKIGNGNWLDCETVGEGIFDQLGLCTDKKEIRGRFRAKSKAEQEAWPPELKRKLGLEP